MRKRTGNAPPPHLKKPPIDKGREEIREDVDDISWYELNKAEKSYSSSHEKLEITFVEQNPKG